MDRAFAETRAFWPLGDTSSWPKGYLRCMGFAKPSFCSGPPPAEDARHVKRKPWLGLKSKTGRHKNGKFSFSMHDYT